MYIGSPPRRRRSSPWRVLTLLVLIGISLYVLVQVLQDPAEPAYVLAPTATPTPTAQSYVAEAEELYWQGDLKEAIVAYERALEVDPTQVEASIALARLLVIEGRTLEAVQRAEQAVEQAPDSAEAWAVLGMAYDWRGQIQRAVEACQRAVELGPEYADAHACLAEAYVDAQRWALARETAETALALDSDSVDVQRNHGYVMEVLGDYREALRSYKRALEIHPRLAYIHIAVGNNYLALGQFDAAVESFQRAAEIDPQSPRAFHRLGRTHYERGELSKAQTYLDQAIEADPEFGPAFGYLGFTNWSRRNYEDAIPSLQRAIMLELMASRRRVHRFFITVEDRSGQLAAPSSSAVMTGDFTPLTLRDPDMLRASLTPVGAEERWQGARGSVTLDTRTGAYTVTLEAMPETRPNDAYVGWFGGLNALSGRPLNTGHLSLSAGGVEAAFEATWVEGPRIDYFYTLGLAHFYMAECEEAYPLFEAALQIDPEDRNALEGIRMCDQAGG